MTQVAKFPMKTLNVTQGYGFPFEGVAPFNFSHDHQYALDLAGADGGRDWLYAPFDMVCKRVWWSCNAIWFESLTPVKCADGSVQKIVLMCIHMNDSDKAIMNIRPGKVFLQGEKFYREGTKGYATGNHVHLEVGRAPFNGTGWHKEYVNGKTQWTINNALVPSNVFFIDDTTIMKRPVYRWRKTTTAPRPSTPNPIPPTADIRIGQKIHVSGRLYASGYTTNSRYTDGTFWIYDGKLINGRYRVTNSASRVGKSPIGANVSGYAKVEDIDINGVKLGSISTPPAASSGFKAGDSVLLRGKLCTSSTSNRGAYYNNQHFWIYDGQLVNGRYRVTNSPARVGKSPIAMNVSGFVNPTEIVKK